MDEIDDDAVTVGPYWWCDPAYACISPDFDTLEQAHAWRDGLWTEKTKASLELAVIAWERGHEMDDLAAAAMAHLTLLCGIGSDQCVPVEGYMYDSETKGWNEATSC